MEILRAVVDDEKDVDVTFHGNMLDVLGAVVTAIQGVHEGYRRENPVKAVLFRKMLTGYLNEEAEEAFAPVVDEDIRHYADLSLLGKLDRYRKTKESEEQNGTGKNCEP